MPFVVYAAPWFSENVTRMLGAVAALPEVRLGLVSQDPLERLDPALRPKIVAHWRVDDLLDGGWDSREHAFEAVGELLFDAVDAARAVDVDPELALRAAAERFRARHEGGR